ncbi:BREX-1 system adenine-specific DNA-methyltransferase PglX [Blautia pseudococcoides]|uniref:BREX-1 system adenine-specific DNA-methyltransferase PglX n=1 Tax=Blautia pseudococcoides TaxID=1796616 RepID=UPI00148AF124|nr:BREX-1 system adenine-specific DNA-methyltransferase PglX [Blautia pseudococcoides]QJU15598.1 BREX-1 system adenine-specific DNA-methyltransferase PglX [Blautia pseudococcoides]
MNKTAIKSFAVWARNKLREEIRTRAGFVGIAEGGIAEPLPASTSEIKYFDVGAAQPISVTGKELREREKLVRQLEQQTEQNDGDYKKIYNQMIEDYAYDWFNRLIAIRFMEVNEYFPDNLRVLSSTEEGARDPDIVSLPFSSDLEFSEKEREQIIEWKTNGKSDSLFRFLLKKRCNQLHECLPGLFEEEGDASELMMHFSFVDKDGIIYHLVHDIEEEDWKEQVQIIGWIYQYYNSELKDETFAQAKKGKKISKERIPSATQLFTPDWIVRYMVENALGRIWLEGHPDDVLKAEWKYYLEEAEQEPEVQAQLEEIRKEYGQLTPEELTFIDPCMGSGHILVYAFDVLMQIYESQGYTKRDAVRSILKNNLYGLDIDGRAYQLAYFSIMMKAREYDTRILERGIAPQVYAIQESNGINRNQLNYFGADLEEIQKKDALQQMNELLDTFKDAKEYGSILNVKQYDWELLDRFVGSIVNDMQMNFETVGIDETRKLLKVILYNAKNLARKYDVACTNPPYMGISNGNKKLNDYVKKHYPDSKSDLFAVFIEKCGQMIIRNGYRSMITQHAWMFLSSFVKLRKKMLRADIVNMAHLGARAFEEIGGEVVQTTAFVVRNANITRYKGIYYRLLEPTTQVGKEKMFLGGDNHYEVKQDNFLKIPGSPIAYWVSKNLFRDFQQGKSIGLTAKVSEGIKTGNNEYFLRLWFEVNLKKFSMAKISKEYKWYPHHKGGEFRKWYGNLEWVINWESDGEEIKKSFNSGLQGQDMYFQCVCGSTKVSSKSTSMRYYEKNVLFDSGAPSIMAGVNTKYILALINSKVGKYILNILNPTLNLQVGDLKKIPILYQNYSLINELSSLCIELSRQDWDSFETSWDFKRHPLISFRNQDIFYNSDDKADFSKSVNYSIEGSFLLYQDFIKRRFNQLKSNEEELNRIFIDIYGLQDELTPEVDDKDVTVRKADLRRDIGSLISYAVGCMFGRYSLDTPGLAYAGGEWDATKYFSFIPDKDNVIPITDARYLDDDIVELFIKWLTVVYGKETLEENLDFMAKALGTKGTDSRDIIRNYFLKDFFKDHCAAYSVTGSGKRPIYWLFDSGKQNGFKALIYMHRYHADTIGRVRVSYLHRIQEKYENEVRAIDTMTLHMTDQRQIAIEEKRKEKLLKQIAEVKEYDEKLDHLAAEKIEIDLDDGVKVNYEKVQTDRDGMKYQILAPIK